MCGGGCLVAFTGMDEMGLFLETAHEMVVCKCFQQVVIIMLQLVVNPGRLNGWCVYFAPRPLGDGKKGNEA